ncbi:MAG: glycosyltransferase family 4 protein [Nitrososphaeria archaeon]|jgi:glycosyltransferase involved in cell wall biosynthesis
MTTKILVISEKYWPQGGGAEFATYLILSLLSATNNDLKITVLTGTKEPYKTDGANFIYSDILDTPTKIHLWRNLMTASKLGSFNKIIKNNDITYIPRLAYPLVPNAKKLGKKVLVHLHDYQPITYCAGVFSRTASDFKFGLLDDIRRSMEFEILEKHNVYKALLSSSMTPINRLSKLWIMGADKVICVSKRQGQIVGLVLPEIQNKIKVAYNPLPHIPLIEKKIENPAFLYLGGDRYFKGFHLVLNAFGKVFGKHKKTKLFLATTNYTFNLKAKDTLLKLSDKVLEGRLSIFDRINGEEMSKLYSISNALLFTSIWEEPLSYTVLESMLKGTIPIVSEVGGIPEIVQGTFAEKMVFKPDNLNGLVDKVEYVLPLSGEQLSNIGLSLRNSTLERFNEDSIVQKLSKILLEN